ncbi:MAG: hypothetical protein K9N55_09975 [Phycisphaerae bacterium]|nr:hypothetical protein [Phycisphaerae bacterium]
MKSRRKRDSSSVWTSSNAQAALPRTMTIFDPDSERRYLMREKRVFIFKEELATEPKFYYFYAT